MTYIEIAKYVFSEERVDWELHTLKDKHEQLVRAKQISIYLGNWFFPKMLHKELAAVFNRNVKFGDYSIKTIKKLRLYDRDIQKRLEKYLNIIRARIRKEEEEAAIQKLSRIAEEEEYKAKLLSTMENMELIAKTYCDITGMQLIKKEI